MLLLRLTQTTVAENRYQIEVALEGGGLPRQTAESAFEFSLSKREGRFRVFKCYCVLVF